MTGLHLCTNEGRTVFVQLLDELPKYEFDRRIRSLPAYEQFLVRAFAQLNRWRIELFFKWLKQHLRIKAFYGTSDNAMRAQVWTAISVYLLVAIFKKRHKLDASLYTILQILNLTLFETPNYYRLFPQHAAHIST